ncbi:MAG: hypothetical protein KDA57_00255 [Planctomycetales bacterium]|nr:hypothetical protein [Planctomycetales bacterium]
MLVFEETGYGPAFAGLLQYDRLRPLGAGTPDEGHRATLGRLSLDEAFAHTPIVDSDMARCCLSAVWLLHDFLDESHTISQGIETRSGSFWHGIMHRREGDFSNAKYWFRRVDHHPVYERLAAATNALGEEDFLVAGDWDPFRFVDLCQAAVKGNGSVVASCQKIQQLEWELLFDHCYAAAICRR